MPDFTPRLIATDLDGTIVRSDGTVSARTVAALARVERAGATLVLVTGRPPRWIREIADAVAHRGLAICANGALLYDLHTETITRASLISPEVLATVVGRLRDVLPGLRFAVEYESGFGYEPGFAVGRWDTIGYSGRQMHGEALVGLPGIKLLALDHDQAPDSLMETAHQAVGDLVTVTHSSGSSGVGLLEMSALGVTKASALAELCSSLGVSAREVAAFGDMPNDLPMLSWAARSYAVANAHPAVLSAVTHPAASNDDDGVAQILELLFP